MTGSQIAEEAVTGSCTFRPFVHDETNVGAFLRKPISNTAIGETVDKLFNFCFFLAKKIASQLEKLFFLKNAHSIWFEDKA